MERNNVKNEQEKERERKMRNRKYNVWRTTGETVRKKKWKHRERIASRKKKESLSEWRSEWLSDTAGQCKGQSSQSATVPFSFNGGRDIIRRRILRVFLCDDKWKWKIEPFIIAADETRQDTGRRAYTNNSNISERWISHSKQLIHLQQCTFMQAVLMEWTTCMP